MAHDVFISHSSKDKEIADAVCAALESADIKCWIASRDILSGLNYGGSIVKAIKDTKAMILLFSAHSNSSEQVKREVERAVNKNRPLIIVRLVDIPPSPDLEYFISTPHWFDAVTLPLAGRWPDLARTVANLLTEIRDNAILPPLAPATIPPARVAPNEQERAMAQRLCTLSESYLAERNVPQALEYLRRAVALNGDSEDAQFLLATALLFQGEDIDAAVRQFREVTRLNPQSSLAHQALAMIYQELGNTGDARKSAEAAVAADPASGDARELLDAINSRGAVPPLPRQAEAHPEAHE